jgi:hypothetical protein
MDRQELTREVWQALTENVKDRMDWAVEDGKLYRIIERWTGEHTYILVWQEGDDVINLLRDLLTEKAAKIYYQQAPEDF